MKRSLSMLLAVCLMMTVMSVLGSALAEGKLVEEPTTLTCLVAPTSKLIDITTNDYTLWLEEQTGVHLDFTVIESDSGSTTSLMLNSGEALPDILMVPLTYDQQYLYGQSGVLMNLSDLIRENAPRITQAYMQYPLYAATSTRPDGNIYYITAYEECYHCTGAQKMWINQTWLDNLGLAHPTTPEEFKNMLIAFRDGDANGNGNDSDEIPYSGIYNSWHSTFGAFVMNAYIYDDGEDRLMIKDGKVTPAYTAPEFREGLRFLSDLFKEKLIDENGFVQDGTSAKALTTGADVLVGAIQAGHTGEFCTVDSPNIFQYVALEPLVGPEGNQTCGYYPNVAKSGDGLGLSSTCANPELAIKWTDFLFTEEATICAQYGMQGRDWDYNSDAGVLGLNDEQALFTTFGKAPVYTQTQLQESWEHTAPFLWVDYIFAGQATLGGDSYDLEKVLYDATKIYAPYFPKEFCSNLSFDGDDASFVAMTRIPLRDFVRQAVAEFILGTRDINSDGAWDEYLAQLQGMEMDQFVALMQKGYDAQQAIIKGLSS